MKEVTETTKFSISNQGGACSYFGSSNGLRRDDLLFSLVFTIIMEFFMLLMEDMVVMEQIRYTHEGKVKFMHITFTDDILIFSKAIGRGEEAI